MSLAAYIHDKLPYPPPIVYMHTSRRYTTRDHIEQRTLVPYPPCVYDDALDHFAILTPARLSAIKLWVTWYLVYLFAQTDLVLGSYDLTILTSEVSDSKVWKHAFSAIRFHTQNATRSEKTSAKHFACRAVRFERGTPLGKPDLQRVQLSLLLWPAFCFVAVPVTYLPQLRFRPTFGSPKCK